MATFVAIPVALERAGFAREHHAWMYLGAVAAGFVLMLPAVVGPWAHRERRVFLVAVATVTV
jgi:hypothetical protein